MSTPVSNAGTLMGDTVRLLAPHLAPVLASGRAVVETAALADRLPPVLQGGFECRLAPLHDQLDIQQYIFPASPELTALAAYLASKRKHPGEQEDSLAARLAELCAAWQQPGSLQARTMSELWLEYDAGGSQAAPTPSVFVGLQHHYLARREAQRVVAALLHGLRSNTAATQFAAIDRCFDACPDGAAVSHLGVMLGRQGTAVRLNVKRLRPLQIAPYLRAIGWPGAPAEAEALVNWLAPSVDRVTLCIDVADQVLPTLGLECACVGPAASARGWADLLAALEAHDLCTAGQREALLQWPGTTTPVNCNQPWPVPLIHASHYRPAGQFSLFERRLSHLKVTLRPQRPPEAKAYLWFHHQWWTPARVAAGEAPPVPVDERPYAQRVQAYYDATTETYLAHLGRTFQGWTVETNEVTDAAGSNRFLAARAGIQAGQRIVDAGCGVGGPALDIARAFPGVQIDGITISPVQSSHAQRLIEEAGLAGQVTVRTGDYHALPYASAGYDVVIFLESSGNTENRLGVMREAARVLRPGGTLYIKDAFVRAGALSAPERQSLAEFERIFLYHVPTMAAMAAVLAEAGFDDIVCHDLTGLVSGERWRQALIEPRAGGWGYSALETAHRAQFIVWPVFCGEVIARKAMA